MSDRYFRIFALSKISQDRGLLTKFVQKHLPGTAIPADSISTFDRSVKSQLDNAVTSLQYRRYSRKLKGPSLLKRAGLLTEFVKKHIEEVPIETTTTQPGGFRSEFIKLKAGPKREELVYNEIIRRGLKPKMVPITVPGPDGSKITYKAMSDYVMLDGLRIPMSGQTAQKVANHFGMSLPTSKMTQQIWEAADTKIKSKPLSGSGVTLDGRRYSGAQVVSGLISDPRAAAAYNDIIDSSLKDREPILTAGHGKTIVLTDRPEQLGLYGANAGDKKWNPIQSSEHTGHDTSVHTEYMTWTRLVSGDVTITRPDGKTESKSMDDLLNDPKMYKYVSDSKVKKYKT